MMAAGSAPASRHRLSGFTGFAMASLALIGVAAAGMAMFFKGPGEQLAVVLSALIAWTTQIVAFPAVRKLTASNLITGWAVGSLVRMGTLLVYALLGMFVFKLAMTPALLGLALFYFVSMVIEPLFLRS
jgi:hypothetical protein